jgi:hypothetical protein
MEHPNFFTVRQFVASARISRRTFDKWLDLGFAPRMQRSGQNGPWRIPRAEWVRWFEALEQDRQRLGKPHLRHPMGPERRKRITAGSLVATDAKVTAQPTKKDIPHV